MGRDRFNSHAGRKRPAYIQPPLRGEEQGRDDTITILMDTATLTLLQQMEIERKERLERLRLATRADLERALRELVPGERVIIFGSLTKPGRFQDASDVDIALEADPAHLSQYQLIALLAERLGRRVDVVLLPECRLREKIEREGEPWTLPA